MALQKEKILSNGTTGNYWKVSSINFQRAGMVLTLGVDLYKDSTPGLTPLGCNHSFTFTVTQQEIMGNLVSFAYTKIKELSNADVSNINGVGTHKGCLDLVDAVDA